jgi:ATP-dependent helicase IRC3
VIKLRPYQAKCLDAIEKHHRDGKNRQIVSLPTGSGKTVVFAALIRKMKAKSLVLVHTGELLNQAAEKIKMIAPGLDVGLLNGSTKNFDSQILVGTVQSTRQPQTMERLSRNGFDLLIADEAHHFAADGAKAILEGLGFGRDTKKLLLGFTATAFRSDSRGLGEVFDIISYEKSTKEMIAEGYLAKPKGIKIISDLDFSKIELSGDDYRASSLSKIMDAPEINDLIVRSYLERGEGRKAICFGVNVAHARNLADMFNASGVHSEAVFGDMPEGDRKAALERFRAGETQLLTNCQLLTEGFDAPEVSCVIVARPTRSRGLYQQMAGRGLRIFPNKPDCLILDFCDANHSICNAAILVGDGDCVAAQTDQEKTRQREILKTLPPRLNQKLKTAIVNFNPLGDQFLWTKEGGCYVMRGSGATLKILQEGNDKHRVILARNDKIKVLASALNFEYAFNVGEDFARDHHHLFVISDKGAEWRELPISEKQMNLFRRCGFKSGIKNLSRGQAADLISSGVLKRTG